LASCLDYEALLPWARGSILEAIRCGALSELPSLWRRNSCDNIKKCIDSFTSQQSQFGQSALVHLTAHEFEGEPIIGSPGAVTLSIRSLDPFDVHLSPCVTIMNALVGTKRFLDA
jgi:hypothetical protein